MEHSFCTWASHTARGGEKVDTCTCPLVGWMGSPEDSLEETRAQSVWLSRFVECFTYPGWPNRACERPETAALISYTDLHAASGRDRRI